MNRKILMTASLALGCLFSGDLLAQLPGPGAERDMERIRELERASVLQQDTIVMIDTIITFDPGDYTETQQIIESKYSIYDYCQTFLGINDPNKLMDGQPMKITNPETYMPMTVQWNASQGKLDTLDN